MMKALILAGGLGSRLGNITQNIPKPLVEVCGKPISLHLVDSLKKYKIKHYIFAVGYKKEIFHKTFNSLFLYGSDIEFNKDNPNGLLRKNEYENCIFRLIYTGLYNQTGSRIAQVFDLIDDEIILCTYGDGLSDININKLIETHKKSNNLITITAVKTPSRFGGLSINDNQVIGFSEKKPVANNWINGGFMIISREFRNKYLNKLPECTLEQNPLEQASLNREVGVYFHEGFWQCMDTPRDLEHLENKFRNIS